ncbi:hypothetical protein SAMN05444320_105441 [Streptoalloteichus hindustanus]|uniref:Uncharacterized protein n=1 Tax=Streptoalloteichus hindustanus TaxID=2017 RepID=A0A1M5FIC3_STRHI|nr:hypothetical protein SAMN05444320_105441 [Streptoalloteichus hindustanus]
MIRRQIRKNGELFRVCAECEAVWLHEAPVRRDNCTYLRTYMEEWGLTDSWEHFDQLESYDSP